METLRGSGGEPRTVLEEPVRGRGAGVGQIETADGKDENSSTAIVPWSEPALQAAGYGDQSSAVARELEPVEIGDRQA